MTEENYAIYNIDEETAEDLISSFEEHFGILHATLNKLIHKPSDKELINTAFRSLHTIKGNAGMVGIEPIVNYTHGMEETMGAIREGCFDITAILCELFLTAIDKLRDLHTKYIFNEASNIDEASIAEGFVIIASSSDASELHSNCEQLIDLFTPHSVEDELQNAAFDLNIVVEQVGQHSDYLSLNEAQEEDLIFFRLLSLQVDEQNYYWEKRTDTLLYLALKTAILSDKELDLIQLCAAVYMHDAGMAFVSDTIVNKNAKLNAMETKKLQQHPVWGYNMLKRMSGWEEAGHITLTHHERIDGKGYPHQINTEDIHEGAKLMSIVDAYFAMTRNRADREHRRSVLRALSEINACVDTQFCGYWVKLFNQVIRAEIKNGSSI